MASITWLFFFDKYFSPLGSQLLGDRSHVLEMKCSTLLGQGFSPMFVPLFWIFYGYSLSFHRIENKRNGLQYSLDLELSFWYQTSVFAAKLCMLWSYLSCRSFVPHLNNTLLSVYWFSCCLFCPCFFTICCFFIPDSPPGIFKLWFECFHTQFSWYFIQNNLKFFFNKTLHMEDEGMVMGSLFADSYWGSRMGCWSALACLFHSKEELHLFCSTSLASFSNSCPCAPLFIPLRQ